MASVVPRSAQKAYNAREKAGYHAWVDENGPVKGGQKGFRSLMRARPVAQRPISLLGQKQRTLRAKTLDVLSATRRRGESISKAARYEHTAPDTVRRYLGRSGFFKRGGRWRPTKRDHLARHMASYENGGGVRVDIRDSRTASLLGQYGRDVRYYLRERDPNVLSQWSGKTYRDANGRVHTFETDPNRLMAAIEKSEQDFGVFDIYPDGGASESSLTGEA
jgi:hypothetical protein